MEGYLVLTGIAAVAAGALAAALAVYYRTSRIMHSMERMIDLALSGNFREKEFTEGRISRLEAKMRRYLIQGSNVQRQAERDRENLKSTISNLSHQTKTPIANIILYLQLLVEMEALDGEARQLLSQTCGQAEKLSFLIASLVKMSRLESGIISLSPAKNSVEELARSLYESFAPRAEAEGKSLTVELCSGGGFPSERAGACAGNPCVQDGGGQATETGEIFDSRWTMEAMGNIMDNALKYTPAGGHIRICVMHYEMFARLDISDDGMGIREEEIAKVFGRFYRSSDAAGSEGVGIGLYLAREIVSQENGYIKVRSVYGEGSTFSVFLPKAEH